MIPGAHDLVVLRVISGGRECLQCPELPDPPVLNWIAWGSGWTEGALVVVCYALELPGTPDLGDVVVTRLSGQLNWVAGWTVTPLQSYRAVLHKVAEHRQDKVDELSLAFRAPLVPLSGDGK